MEKYAPFPCEGPNKSKMCIAKFGAPALPEFLPVGTLIRAVPPEQQLTLVQTASPYLHPGLGEEGF